MKDKYLIIDFMNYVHRGLVADFFKKKESKEEDKYSLVYTFFVNLRATVEAFQPTKLFFVLEGHPKHRYELYSGYKENRIIKTGDVKSEEKSKVKTKIHFASQVIRELLLNFNCSLIRHPDFEADDCINTLCHRLSDEDVTVITSDSDAIQLLQKGFKDCKVYNPVKKTYFEAGPYPYVAEKAIRGDKSDNIQRVLTPKKADAALSNPEILKKVLELPENLSQFNINKQLIEFIIIPEDELEVSVGESDFNTLKSKFSEMDFKSFVESGNEKAETKWNKFVSTFNNLVI